MPNIFRLGGGETIKKTLLWTNPNSKTSMINDVTVLDFTGYDYVMVNYKRHKDDVDTTFYTTISKLESNGCIPLGAFFESTKYITRTFEKRTSGWGFANCYDSAGGGRYNHIIPLKVYGLKGNIAGGGSQ